jgi:hypothetical protein
LCCNARFTDGLRNDAVSTSISYKRKRRQHKGGEKQFFTADRK